MEESKDWNLAIAIMGEEECPKAQVGLELSWIPCPTYPL